MKKLFSNDKFFAISMIISVLGMLVYASRSLYRFIVSAELNYITHFLTYVIFPICLIVLYISYKKHSKNVMKAMMGALLMTLVIDSISYFYSYEIFDIAFAISYLFIAVGLFTSHMIINENHHPSSKAVSFNIILILLLIVLQIVWLINTLPSVISDTYMTISFFGYILGYIFMSIVIVCIETRLDAYRIKREVAGWTEEKR